MDCPNSTQFSAIYIDGFRASMPSYDFTKAYRHTHVNVIYGFVKLKLRHCNLPEQEHARYTMHHIVEEKKQIVQRMPIFECALNRIPFSK